MLADHHRSLSVAPPRGRCPVWGARAPEPPPASPRLPRHARRSPPKPCQLLPTGPLSRVGHVCSRASAGESVVAQTCSQITTKPCQLLPTGPLSRVGRVCARASVGESVSDAICAKSSRCAPGSAPAAPRGEPDRQRRAVHPVNLDPVQGLALHHQQVIVKCGVMRSRPKPCQLLPTGPLSRVGHVCSRASAGESVVAQS
jgi:hypothetical protein